MAEYELGYDAELERAELLGITPISREEWERQEKERKERQAEELGIAVAEEIASEEETIKGTSGKLDELNSILTVTQQKINKFKNVCGSLTSLLKIRSASPCPNPASTSNENDAGEGTSKEPEQKNDINSALDALDNIKINNETSEVSQFTKKTALDLNQKVSKNLDALDRLIDKADNAQYALSHQNKQMKSFLK